MSGSQPTPGPWSVQHDGAGYAMIAGSEAIDSITEARYHWIANVLPVPLQTYKGGKERQTGGLREHEANARLIAAAPMLAEALRLILESEDVIRQCYPDLASLIRGMADGRKALSAATGGA